MGCDIHLYVEELQANGTWVCLDTIEQINDDGFLLWERTSQPFYMGQNYDLFSILADVRNQPSGRLKTFLSGRPRREKLRVINEPRGLPSNMSSQVKALARFWQEADGHSFSWLILAEVLEFDWEQTTERDGEVYSYKALVPEFWEQTIARLEKVNTPDKIRLVFWFDN